MKRRFRWDKKYLNWGITAFCVIAAAVLFYMLLRFLPDIGGGFGKLSAILSPFIWGLIITYLISPLMKFFDRTFRKKGMDEKRKFSRGFAVFLSEIILLVIIAALILLIFPQLYSSVETIVTSSPEYLSQLTSWVEVKLAGRPQLEEYISEAIGTLNTDLMDLLKTRIMPQLGSVVSNLTTGVYAVVKSVYNLIVGIIVSAYILSNLEGFTAGARRILYSVFSIETAEKIRSGASFVDRTFMGFINGKLLDSLIIGLICYVVCALLRMPYTLLVSVIVGVTNIIPFFGPFIGAIPCALLILLVNPLKCFVFIVFILILQQIDGNVIGPKILGNSIGISSFWIMFSIILGAGLFGFWGMLLGVPVFKVVYTGIDGMINRKLERSNLPRDVRDYSNIDYIDSATREVHLKPLPARQTERKGKRKKSGAHAPDTGEASEPADDGEDQQTAGAEDAGQAEPGKDEELKGSAQ